MLGVGFSMASRICCACIPTQIPSTVRGIIATKPLLSSVLRRTPSSEKTKLVMAKGKTGDNFVKKTSCQALWLKRLTIPTTLGSFDKYDKSFWLSKRNVRPFTKAMANRLSINRSISDCQPKKYPITIAKNVGGVIATADVTTHTAVTAPQVCHENWRRKASLVITRYVIHELHNRGSTVRTTAETRWKGYFLKICTDKRPYFRIVT